MKSASLGQSSARMPIRQRTPAPIRDTSSPSTYAPLGKNFRLSTCSAHEDEPTETLADFTRCTTALMATTVGCLADRCPRKRLMSGFTSSLQGADALELVTIIESA